MQIPRCVVVVDALQVAAVPDDLDVAIDEADIVLRAITASVVAGRAVVALLLVPHDTVRRDSVLGELRRCPIEPHLWIVAAPVVGAGVAGAEPELVVLDVGVDDIAQKDLTWDLAAPVRVDHPAPAVVDDIAVAGSSTSLAIGEAFVVVLDIHQHAKSELLEV